MRRLVMAREAKAFLQPLEYQKARELGTPEALETFLSKYPKLELSREARGEVARLEDETNAKKYRKLTRGVPLRRRGKWRETALHAAALILLGHMD